jgi:hypothetical protein
MSVIERETMGVTARIQSPTITASRIATLRTGSRAANHKSKLSMSAKPPASLENKKEQCRHFRIGWSQKDTHYERLASKDHEKTSKTHQQ